MTEGEMVISAKRQYWYKNKIGINHVHSLKIK